MLDIPVHKLANNKSLIESLHVLFTLFSEFRQNQHFKNQENGNQGTATDMAQFWEVVNNESKEWRTTYGPPQSAPI